MALPFTSSKRPFESHPNELYGRGKWQKTSPSVSQPIQRKVPPGSVVFRVLCPSSNSGSVIGKGGGVVAKIRQETGARIKLEEIVYGCDERVVTISGSTKDSDFRKFQNKLDDSDSNADGGENGKASAEDGKEKEDSSNTDDSKSAKAISSVQKALLLIFERIIDGVQENDDANMTYKKSSFLRLLVFSNQVGCLLGKGGSVIKQMSTDSGAQIRILPRTELPLCASPLDEIVQIAGTVDSRRIALQLVSQQLMDNPPRDCDFPGDNPPWSSSHPGQMPAAPEFLVFRLLCTNDKVGCVIGNGGSIMQNLRRETGCEINIQETAAETEYRIIFIAGPAVPGDKISPSQDALLRVLHRFFVEAYKSKDNAVMARLLITPDQTGCLLGKGGSIITEMRKLSGACIRILSQDLVPKGVSENEEIVQVSGEFETVRDAILQITGRLRGHLFRDKASDFLDQMRSFGSYMGREPSPPPRLYAGARPLEDRSAFAHPIHGSPWFNKIVGRVDSIRKVLQSVSQQLMENPPRNHDFTADNPPGSSSHPYAPNPRPEPLNTANYHIPVQRPPFPNRSPFDAADISPFPKFHEGPVPGQMPAAPEALFFRLLCSKHKIGGVIGKGGNIVKNLQLETGCQINVLETAAETEYRIIVISGPALPGDRISPSQDALIRIFKAASESKDSTFIARLLVTPNQTSCLIGKGGSIISEMRKITGASIRIFSQDLVPKSVSDDDEVVQVSGEYGAVQKAILQISARLRGHLFHDKTSSFIDQIPPFGSYMGREPSPPPRLYALARPHEDRSAIAHPIHGSPLFTKLNVRWH